MDTRPSFQPPLPLSLRPSKVSSVPLRSYLHPIPLPSLRPRHAATATRTTRIPVTAAAAADRLLWATDITKTHDGRVFQFRDESISLHRGDKIAILGPNGSGKSTLLSVLANLAPPDSGTVHLRKGCVAALVSQSLPSDLDLSEPAALAVLRLAARHSASPPVRAALRHAVAVNAVATAALASQSDTDALAALSAAAAAMDGTADAWQLDSYAAAALDRLSVSPQTPLSSMSGGQRRRVAIAAALVAQPNILLLDEVTNHLSIDAIQFLEDALTDPNLTVVAISHDRAFVDNVCTSAIWELDGDLHRYPAGYHAFLRLKAERLSADERKLYAMRKALRKELEWLRRQPKARSTKNKSRIDQANQLDTDIRTASRKNQGRTLAVKDLTSSTSRLGGDVVELDNITIKRGDTVVVKDFSYTFERGERVGVVGGNGVGKSSLLRAIIGEIPIQEGSVHVGETVVFGHFEQEGLDLDSILSEGTVAVRGVSSAEDLRVMDFVTDLVSAYREDGAPTSAAGGTTTSVTGGMGRNGAENGEADALLESQIQELSYSVRINVSKKGKEPSDVRGLRAMSPLTLLKEFGFDRDKQFTLVRHLSGGERRRLQLMGLLMQNANFLVLDEITNDIDVGTLTMLEESLVEYSGVLVLCSHDRFMVDRLVDHLLVVEGDGRVRLVEGRFTEYLEDEKRLAEEAKRQRKDLEKEDGKKREKGNDKRKRRLNLKERKEFGRLEQEIEEHQKEQERVSQKLGECADGSGAGGYKELEEWSERLAQLERTVEEKTERWMELAEVAEEGDVGEGGV